MRTAIDVSFIIVNWNRFDDVLKNVRYLKRQRRVKFEVVVVDNGSTDGSAERLARIGWIRLIRLATNVGPAAARNYGIGSAKGKYVVFLDSDAVLSKSGLVELVSRMESNPTIGIISCRIVNSRTRRPDAWIHALPASSHELKEFDTYSFSAAGAIARTEALLAAGPFWDELFIYQEEVDLSIRNVEGGLSDRLLALGPRIPSRLRGWQDRVRGLLATSDSQLDLDLLSPLPRASTSKEGLFLYPYLSSQRCSESTTRGLHQRNPGRSAAYRNHPAISRQTHPGRNASAVCPESAHALEARPLAGAGRVRRFPLPRLEAKVKMRRAAGFDRVLAEKGA